MSTTRTKAIYDIATATPAPAKPAEPVNVDFYGEDVFNAEAMRSYLPKDICEKLLATIDEGAPLDPNIAGDVAHAMKKWAMDRGARSPAPPPKNTIPSWNRAAARPSWY